MKNQSKIIASLLVGVAVGATLGILFSSKKGQGILDYLISSQEEDYKTKTSHYEDEWGDFNDALGG